jgi:hypothetical protein
MRPVLLPLAAALLALVAVAAVARAEEVFVLDNGTVLRGTVVHEDARRVVVRLTGLAVDNTLTLEPKEITRRYVAVDPRQHGPDVPHDVDAPEPDVPLASALTAPRTIRYDREGRARVVRPEGKERPRELPVGEPGLARESFFQRLERVTRLAFPASLEGRLLVGFLLLVVLTMIVAGGTKILGMKPATLHASTTLGLLLGAFLLGDILLYSQMLRADRALWVLPLQGVIWLGTARGLLDAPLARTIPLFAMVLFLSTCFVFATGSLLVSV